MSLLTNPPDFTASLLTSTALNTLKNTIYNDYGTSINGQGSISDSNIAVAAALQRTKIADTAVVCGNTTGPGTQTISKPTVFSGTSVVSVQSAWIQGNSETVASATNMAINPAVLYHVVTGTTTINTITGATNEGTVAIFIFQGVLSITGVATDTLNTIHHNSYASGVAPAVTFTTTGATALIPYMKKYVYTKLAGTFTNLQWFEVPT